MSHRSGNRIRVLTLAAVGALIWLVSGCSDTPMPYQSGSSSPTVHIVARANLGKPATATWIEQKAVISREAGGKIVIDDPVIGRSELDVPPNALSEDTEITMRVSTSGPVVVEFSPHMAFLVPVRATVSYKGADLANVDPATLRLYYNNEQVGQWEPTLSYSESSSLTVTASLEHFSQYAVGSEE